MMTGKYFTDMLSKSMICSFEHVLINISHVFSDIFLVYGISFTEYFVKHILACSDRLCS